MIIQVRLAKVENDLVDALQKLQATDTKLDDMANVV